MASNDGSLLPLINDRRKIIHPEDLPYQINPEYPGYVLRFLFAAEVVINAVELVFLLFYPDRVLNLFLAEGVPVSTPLITLMQFFGMLYVGITIVTALGVPNTPIAIETRTSVYRMYAVLDFMAVTSLHYLAWKGPEYSGFSPKAMTFLGNYLIGALLQRLIPLIWFPASFGRYEYILDSGRGN
ncbi:hypothetical protein H072_3181 [Dactylellina haptotyla CBS 200.50]|uniref:EXPERA domain-containing protein n=1 Tax=Dactylellina haptotyla (strain CBS 200.50) TaxID=1284197 RepID=S8BTS5_DACHA|nr:hypothetical protein H072_3181 [Dactylellina haptotyla CBS 200.50]